MGEDERGPRHLRDGRRHRSDKEVAVSRNEALLVADLAEGRLVFRSRPHEAHVQFSTHCNMSCVMCWNGANPPVDDMDRTVLERFGREVASTLSILIPHDGSEPTSRMWHTACEFARTHDLRMHLTTNVQGLSPRRLRDALDVIVSLDLSVDSHRPEVLARMRPGARTRAIFRNLPEIASIAHEAEIDCEVNIVFTTENARDLADTIDHFGALGLRAVSIIRLVDINGSTGAIDPLLDLEPDELREIRDRSVAVAAARGMRLRWLLDDSFDCDVPDGAGVPESEAVADDRNGHLRLAHPGFCRFAHSAVRITAFGDIAPCGYAAGTDLLLGNLGDHDFESIWNGANAQDLRRAMFTGDLPSLCTTCQHADPPPEQSELDVFDGIERYPSRKRRQPRVVGPDHLHRAAAPPRLVLDDVPWHARRFVLIIASAGVRAERREHDVPVVHRRGGRVELDLAATPVWSTMDPNTGYWWTIGHRTARGRLQLFVSTARCLIRSEPIARIPGSTLRYPDSVDVPVDLVRRSLHRSPAEVAPVMS